MVLYGVVKSNYEGYIGPVDVNNAPEGKCNLKFVLDYLELQKQL